MEAFSDGVFSIAATLLVLEIALHPPGTPLEQVLDAWPAYLGYVISFLTIGAAWLGHDSTVRLLLTALDAYARSEHLYAHGEADEELQTERRELWPVLAGYVIAIFIGLAAPTVAVVLYFALGVFLVVPFRDVRRLLFGRS